MECEWRIISTISDQGVTKQSNKAIGAVLDFSLLNLSPTQFSRPPCLYLQQAAKLPIYSNHFQDPGRGLCFIFPLPSRHQARGNKCFICSPVILWNSHKMWLFCNYMMWIWIENKAIFLPQFRVGQSQIFTLARLQGPRDPGTGAGAGGESSWVCEW